MSKAKKKKPPKISSALRNSSEYLRKFIQEYKARPCADCNNSYFGGCTGDFMSFDHLPQYVKKFDIGMVSKLGSRAGISFRQLVREIKKCQVVCWSCHKEREEKRKISLIERRRIRFEKIKKIREEGWSNLDAFFQIMPFEYTKVKKQDPFQLVWSDPAFIQGLKWEKQISLMQAALQEMFALMKRLAWAGSYGILSELSLTPVISVSNSSKVISTLSQLQNLTDFAYSVARGCIYIAKRDRLPLPVKRDGKIVNEIPEPFQNDNGAISRQSP